MPRAGIGTPGCRITGWLIWTCRTCVIEDRAVLVGRTDEPWMPLSVQTIGATSKDAINASVETYSFVRLVLPVVPESNL